MSLQALDGDVRALSSRLHRANVHSAQQPKRQRLNRTSLWFSSVRIPLGRPLQRHLDLPVLRSLLPNTLAPHKRRDSYDQHSVPYSSRLLLPITVTLVTFLLPLVAFGFLVLFLLSRRTTLAYSQHDIQRIWRWEIAQGHHPSLSTGGVPLTETELGQPSNPGMPRRAEGMSWIPGSGHARHYLPLPAVPIGRDMVAFPPRPLFGSILDLDRVMAHCDFGQDRYVRDCLEVLRVNAGLQKTCMRRGRLDSWRMTFVTAGQHGAIRSAGTSRQVDANILTSPPSVFSAHLSLLERHTLSAPSTDAAPHSRPHASHPSADPACDPDNPRIFHIFWAGPFSDKPYSAALSFLYTQRLQLDLPVSSSAPSSFCRPQLWIWINPGPASSLPNSHANEDMRLELESNEWSAPLLHPRFAEVIKFKLWNTTEQLDDIKEMQGWRNMRLFNTHGKKFKNPTVDPNKPQDKLFSRVGSADSKNYDRLSVVLSDMARFVLTFRFGGIYLDADTLLLRDWEELFGWRGAFGYRWSRLPLYNTAVLKMSRGSAIGSWVFRTAVANGLDFHPMTLSRYTKDAGVDGLILRLPDALFDPPWLNVEDFQRDRPAFPNFKSFDDFFETPEVEGGGAALVAAGFEGFFRGAFSYHWHNAWWRPFDPLRNYPDLGRRFLRNNGTERSVLAQDSPANSTDLSWSAVLKRTMEGFLREEVPNMYGEWIEYNSA